jgi:hypothetical protein
MNPEDQNEIRIYKRRGHVQARDFQSLHRKGAGFPEIG